MPQLIDINEQVMAIGERFLIGRDITQCQLVLTEPYISRLQAVIEVNAAGQAAIKNLSSRQTTYVNGQAIDTCYLRDGDRVELGSGQTILFYFRQNGGGEVRPSSFAFEPAPSPSAVIEPTIVGYQQPQPP